MEQTRNDTRKYWIYTLISFIVMVALLVVIPAWFWLALPFFLTYLVMAFNSI